MVKKLLAVAVAVIMMICTASVAYADNEFTLTVEKVKAKAKEYEDDDDEDDKYRVKESMHGDAKWEEDDDWCEKLKRTSFKQVDEHQAMEWVSEMKSESGKPMPMYRIDDTEDHRKTLCPDCDKWEFFVAMNAMYADYQPAAVKCGADRPDFYAMLAKLFLEDKDAGQHKLQKYMMAIPK